MNKELVLVKRDETGKIVAIVVKVNGLVEVYTCAIAGFDELEDLLKV